MIVSPRTLQNLKKIAFILVMLAFIAIELGARAGGAGGGHSSSSSSSSGSSHYSGSSSRGGSGDLLFFIYIFNAIGPIPSILIIIGIIILFYLYGKKRSSNANNVYRNLNRFVNPNRTVKGLSNFKTANPDFQENLFLEKAKIAFTAIQEAWSQKDLSRVRPYISDGVYQRFNTQFLMMNELEQNNKISNLHIIQAWIDAIDRDNGYDIIHVGIHAECFDEFKSKKLPQYTQSGNDDFIEYWSFLRKKGKPKTEEWADIYQNDACPNCGANLPENLGERSQCPHCSTLINSGEYDWVLSEITQADDYTSYGVIGNKSNIQSKLKSIYDADSNFSIQLVEDKASNAYLQILSSQVSGDPSRMRRFVNDEAFERLKVEKDDANLIFNRLFLNRVLLSAIMEKETSYILAFTITQSSQRVSKEKNTYRVIDPAIRQDDFVLLMERQKSTVTTKGSLYQHQCPSCGAPLSDSLSNTCGYCNSVLNSGSHEWVVKDLFDFKQYENWLTDSGSEIKGKINPAIFDQLFSDKDLAMNNLMVMIASDGIFADSEREFAETAAKKWGYRIDNIQVLFDMAATGRLRLQIPDDDKRKEKMLKLLKEAAIADGEISQEEQEILNYIESA